MRQTPTSPHLPDLAELRAWLEEMVRALKFVELVVAVVGLIGRMRDINLELTKRVAHLTRKRPRSENLERLERQLALSFAGFVGAVASATSSDQASSAPPKIRRRSPHAGGRGSFPAEMERLKVVNPIPPGQRTCPICGGPMKTITHKICERITVIPAKIIVEQRLDETIACPNDDTIITAPPPPAIVERGKLTDALIVEATCDKYLDHQPIERQCQRFARAGAEIAPQTLGRSVGAHLDLLAPVAKLIVEQTRGPGLLGTDATSIPILDPDADDGIRSGTMWCWTNARWVTFFYARNGDSDSVRRFLGKDLARTVQCDGTQVTTFLERAGGRRATRSRPSQDTARSGARLPAPSVAAPDPLSR